MVLVLSGSHGFSVVLVDSQCFWFLLIPVGSQCSHRLLSEVLVGSQCFSVLLVGSQYSHRFSVVLAVSQVLVGSRFSVLLSRFLLVLNGSQWFLVGSHMFSVVLNVVMGSQCSRRFSVVLSGSLNGSLWFFP